MPSVSDQQKRLTYARNLSACIARNDLHSMLTVKDSDGAAPIVIALGHEKVDAVFPRIERAGGSANLFVVDSNESLHVVKMTSSAVAGTGKPLEGREVDDVHRNVTMDFLVFYMRSCGNGQGSFRVSFPGVEVAASEAPEFDLAALAG